MRLTRLPMTFVAACAGLLAISSTACNRDAIDQTNRTGTIGTSGSATQAPAMTLTGCLQKGSGFHEYILTPSGRTGAPVGTSGTAGGSVEDRQIAVASKSYRLSGDNDQLTGLVGKQVRVTGKLDEKANLPAGTSGSDRDANRERSIDSDDLAKVDVQMISQIADACGTGSKR